MDGYVNQVLRATVDTEQLTGPGDFRFQLQKDNGRARLLLSRWPILSVLSGQWTPAGAFPAQWTVLAANQFRVERPVIGVYGTSAASGSGDGGQSVLMAPGNATWLFGRKNIDVQVTYINGWPHGSLTAAASAGATTIAIDDCTGWGPPSAGSFGAAGIVYDQNAQEGISVTAASATSGPGTLTLSQPLQFAHGAGVMVSAMPGSIQQATILYAVAQAIVRGSTATTVQAVPGSSVGPGATQRQFVEAAEGILKTYRRML